MRCLDSSVKSSCWQCGSHATHGQLAYKTMLSGLPNTSVEPCTQGMVVAGLRGDIIQIFSWKDREIVVVDAWPKDPFVVPQTLQPMYSNSPVETTSMILILSL